MMERAGVRAEQPDALAAAAMPAGGRAEWVPLAIIYGLLAAGTIFVAAITPNFLSASNFEAILRNTALVGIVAVAMTPITLSGNFVSLGISQSAMAAMLGFIFLIREGWSQPIAVLAVLAGLVQVDPADVRAEERAIIASRSPSDWIDDQLADIEAKRSVAQPR